MYNLTPEQREIIRKRLEVIQGMIDDVRREAAGFGVSLADMQVPADYVPQNRRDGKVINVNFRRED